MPNDVTQAFMRALQEAEASNDPSPIVALYADDSTTENLSIGPLSGVDGARDFWRRYLDVFSDIRSEFFHSSDDDRTGTMEWVARGHLASGKPIEYKGISVIEVENGKVKKFRSYYDSAAFVHEAPAQ